MIVIDKTVKMCVSCMKRPAAVKIGVRHLCQHCKDSRDKAIQKAKK